MKIGVVSDIHANIVALEAVVEHGKSLGVTKWICLGDIVGYGPNPNECVEWVKNNCEITVLGNHDNVAIRREEHEYFNPYARQAIVWTQDCLSEESIEFLENLPYTAKAYDSLFVHASPKSPSDWFYVTALDDALECFDYFRPGACFIGHTHCPQAVQKPDDDSFHLVEGSEFTYEKGEKALVNVGSVGQPRDHDSKASYVTFDAEDRRVQFHRIKYDIAKVQKQMKELEFAEYLYQRLSKGR